MTTKFWYLVTNNGTDKPEKLSFVDFGELCDHVEHAIDKRRNKVAEDLNTDQEFENLDADQNAACLHLERGKSPYTVHFKGTDYHIEHREPRTVAEIPNDDTIVLIQTSQEYAAVREHFPDLPENGSYCFVITDEADYYACFVTENAGVPWLHLPIKEIQRGY